ncbi:hypothetical protein DH2020_014742 [Rehmannia glutinosa]|uniref:Auxin response factor n=1 Tax=Rehmannia glutinosa TaxID=99300 RepID=A0ABR0WXE6_REHGL
MTITFIESKEKTEETEKCVDSQFWHACAGSMIQMPPVNSKAFYFPQGHLEQCSENVDLGSCPRFPPCIPCTVSTIKLLATPKMDEVFAKIRLVPVNVNTLDFDNDGTIEANVENQDKPPAVTKMLTKSDANCGGGFSVPKYCADMVFPKLECGLNPPAQTIHVKDVHGGVWNFKHIFRGRPRQHLLTTGWSGFVNSKKLMSGDSITFMRLGNGDLCVGIRRGRSSRGRVKVEDVIGAATLAVSGKPFEVIYWPGAGMPEFCVRASLVMTAMRVHWSHGMRFKMAFELEDWMRIGWYTGTILSVEVVDPVLWPDSPWRRLQVQWDEHNLLQNMKRISPWQVVLESSMPPLLPPHLPKKMRLPQHPDCAKQVTSPTFSNNQFLGSYNNLIGCRSDNTPAGMQGARHPQHGFSLPNRYSSLFPGSFLHTPIIPEPGISENKNSGQASEKSDNNNDKAAKFVLFGQPIHTEEQISSMSRSSDTVLNSSYGCNADKVGNTSDGSGSHLNRNDASSCEGFQALVIAKFLCNRRILLGLWIFLY